MRINKAEDEGKNRQAELASIEAALKLLQSEGLLSSHAALVNFSAITQNHYTSHIEEAIHSLQEAGLLPGHEAQGDYVKDLRSRRDASQIRAIVKCCVWKEIIRRLSFYPLTQFAHLLVCHR